MRRFLLFAIIVLFFVTVMAEGILFDDPEKGALLLLEKYSNESYRIAVMTSRDSYSFSGCKVFGDPFKTHLKGDSRYVFLSSLSVAIHESTHYYSEIYSLKRIAKKSRIKSADDYFCYYESSGQGILVKVTSVFPSRDIKDIIDENLRGIYYKVYIDSNDSSLVSQGMGIYGLLDEMNAYIRGARVVLDLYPLYIQNNPGEGLIRYQEDIVPDITAALDFRYYIFTYLIHAQNNRPNIYKGIVNNRAFLTAMIKIDNDLYKLLSDYYQNKKEIEKQYSKFSIKISESGSLMTIDFPDESRLRTVLNCEHYRLMNAKFNEPSYQAIAKVLGAFETLPGYKSFK
ncbi:MAG: hypothetical protein JXK07_08485 [Spirochaetes bacterium]|nr:hypothetical protein [Spirochaetota bacterium]MBN2770949.1 hypothetical protein [Spirochaetota bacterium]